MKFTAALVSIIMLYKEFGSEEEFYHFPPNSTHQLSSLKENKKKPEPHERQGTKKIMTWNQLKHKLEAFLNAFIYAVKLMSHNTIHFEPLPEQH